MGEKPEHCFFAFFTKKVRKQEKYLKPRFFKRQRSEEKSRKKGKVEGYKPKNIVGKK